MRWRQYWRYGTIIGVGTSVSAVGKVSDLKKRVYTVAWLLLASYFIFIFYTGYC